MKIISIVTVTQIICWIIFVFGDYLSETVSNDILLYTALLLLPVIIPIAYLIFQKKVHYDSVPGWVNTLTVLLVWGVENLIFGRIIIALQIVPQAYGGWEHFLNGIEYLMFPLFNIALAVIIVSFWNLVVFIYKKIKE